MLQNAYFLAKIGADTAENEQHFAEILPKIGNYPTGPTVTPAHLGVRKRVVEDRMKAGEEDSPTQYMRSSLYVHHCFPIV